MRSQHSPVDDRNILNEINWKTNFPTHPQTPPNTNPAFSSTETLATNLFTLAHLHRQVKFTTASWYTCKVRNLLRCWELGCKFFSYNERRIDREYYIQPRCGYHGHKPSATSPASNNGKPPASTDLESKAGKQKVPFGPGAKYASISIGISVHPYPAVGRHSNVYWSHCCCSSPGRLCVIVWFFASHHYFQFVLQVLSFIRFQHGPRWISIEGKWLNGSWWLQQWLPDPEYHFKGARE